MREEKRELERAEGRADNTGSVSVMEENQAMNINKSEVIQGETNDAASANCNSPKGKSENSFECYTP